MAQGTGQASRRQTGKEKASGRNSASKARSKSASARGSTKASSNGRASGSAKATSRSTKAPARSSKATGRSTKATAGSTKSGSRSTKASASQHKRRTASASASRSSRASARGSSRKARSKQNALTKPLERAIALPIGLAFKAARRGAGKAAETQGAALEVAGKSAKVARIGTKELVRVVRAAAPGAGPVGALGAAAAIAGVSAQAFSRRQRRSQSKVPQPRLSDLHMPHLHAPHLRMPHLPLPKRPQKRRGLPDVHVSLGRAELISMAAVGVGLRVTPIAKRLRHLPIQQSIDIAVPLDVVYDEWMRLDFLPEGAHCVEKIERQGDDTLDGKVTGRLLRRKWEAEVRDERDAESFAWRSVKGSDCAGLVTFHRLGDRLTRLELQLDVVPVRTWEAIDFALRLADLRTRSELRRFKARLETISPDEYEDQNGYQDEDEDQDEDEQDTNNKEA